METERERGLEVERKQKVHKQLPFIITTIVFIIFFELNLRETNVAEKNELNHTK